MASTTRDLALVLEAKAYQIEEFLLLRIAGEKPDGCHVVDLESSLLDVEPPGFIATWHVPPNVRCIPEPVVYEYQEAFAIGMKRDVVTLHHAGGQMTVYVDDLSPEIGRMALTRETDPNEAVGFSPRFDFTEAFRDAIDKIPVPPIPDWLMTYSVLEIGAEIGGIRGLDRMFVRVRGE